MNKINFVFLIRNIFSMIDFRKKIQRSVSIDALN